jgi:hypothetical protein
MTLGERPEGLAIWSSTPFGAGGSVAAGGTRRGQAWRGRRASHNFSVAAPPRTARVSKKPDRGAASLSFPDHREPETVSRSRTRAGARGQRMAKLTVGDDAEDHCPQTCGSTLGCAQRGHQMGTRFRVLPASGSWRTGRFDAATKPAAQPPSGRIHDRCFQRAVRSVQAAHARRSS